MYTQEQILNLLRVKKPELEKRYAISELGLFGSYARGDYHKDSDIDILVDFNRRIDGFDYIKLAHELEDLFRHKIDMVSRGGIKLQYLPSVEKNLIHVWTECCTLLKDIETSITKIITYTQDFTFAQYEADNRTREAVERNFEIIGEAASRVGAQFTQTQTNIEWRILKDFRNFIIHEYFGINNQIIWDTIRLRLPQLLQSITHLISLQNTEGNSWKIFRQVISWMQLSGV